MGKLKDRTARREDREEAIGRAIKAIEEDTARRVAEIENIRDGVGPKRVGPDG